MSEFNFDIDQIANNAISKSDKTTEIITDQVDTSGKTISFYEKLSPEQQSAISSKAPALVDSFMANQNTLLDFGQSAVEGVNATVNHILREQKKLEIPQVDDLLKKTNQELNGFVAKYKDVGPADLEKKPNLLQKLFKQSKNTLQEFYFDAQNIEQKMDGMAAAVVKQEDTLARNIVSAELLIEDNTKSIENLVGVIAFVEASLKEATQRAQALQTELKSLDAVTPEYQSKTDLLARTTEVVNTLEQQHTLRRVFYCPTKVQTILSV